MTVLKQAVKSQLNDHLISNLDIFEAMKASVKMIGMTFIEPSNGASPVFIYDRYLHFHDQKFKISISPKRPELMLK